MNLLVARYYYHYYIYLCLFTKQYFSIYVVVLWHSANVTKVSSFNRTFVRTKLGSYS